jgi:SAM-dependent methyltransferase
MAKAMSAARPGSDPDEWAHMLKYLQSNEEPFLELACGYGRMLLSIMEAGYRIVGTDSSPEMLEQCRVLARQKGLQPVLQQQFMQRLSLDEKFGFIFIDDCTFTLVIEDQDVIDLFERVWIHLKPGGTFLFDFFPFKPDAQPTNDQLSTCWVKAPDNSIYVSRKIQSYDPRTGITRTLQIHDRYVYGKFVSSQAYEDPNRNHDPSVVMDLLSKIGFIDIKLGGYHSDDPPASDASMVSIRCKKPK